MARNKLCSRCSNIDNLPKLNPAESLNICQVISLGTRAEPDFGSSCSLCGQLSQSFARYPEELGRKQEPLCLIAFPTSALFANAWTWEHAPYGVTATTSLSIMDLTALSEVSRVH